MDIMYPIILVAAWLASACVLVEAGECVQHSSGEYFREEELFREYSVLGAIAANWRSNEIYTIKESIGSEYHVLAWDIENKTYSVLGKVPNFCSFTVDQRHGKVYAGCFNHTGSGGLYAYDGNVQQFVKLTAKDGDIAQLHYADKLYFTDMDDHKLQTYTRGKIQPLNDFHDIRVYNFVFDGRGDLVYSYRGHLYHRKKSTTDDVEIPTNNNFRKVAVDPHGNVYGGWKGIFHVNTTDYSVQKVLDMAYECESLTIDKDNNFVCVAFSPSRLVRFVRCTI